MTHLAQPPRRHARLATCLYTADWQQESVLVASGSDVLRMSTDHVGGLVDDVIFSTTAGDDVTAISYDVVSAKLYVGVKSSQHGADCIASVDTQQLPVSRYFFLLFRQ